MYIRLKIRERNLESTTKIFECVFVCVCMCGQVRGNVCFVVEVSTKVESKCVYMIMCSYLVQVKVRTHGTTFTLVGVGMMFYFDCKR